MTTDERLAAVLAANLEPWWRCVHPSVPMGMTMTIHECRRCEDERAETAESLADALREAGWVQRDEAENDRLREELDEHRAHYVDPVEHARVVAALAMVEGLADQVDVLYPPKFKFGAEANYVAGYHAARADLRAALAARAKADPGPCTGAGDCNVPLHVHGCFADLDGTCCDDPTDHPAPCKCGWEKPGGPRCPDCGGATDLRAAIAGDT